MQCNNQSIRVNNTTIVWNRSAATAEHRGTAMNFSGAFKDRIINAFDGVTVQNQFHTVSFNETGLNLNASERRTLLTGIKQFKALQDLDERIGARNSSVYNSGNTTLNIVTPLMWTTTRQAATRQQAFSALNCFCLSTQATILPALILRALIPSHLLAGREALVQQHYRL